MGQLLEEMGHHLQGNRKMLKAGDDHPDRDAQFRNINAACLLYMEDQQPVVSMDCRKKETVGNDSDSGREWQEKYTPIKTKDHDWKRRKQLHLEYLTLQTTRDMLMLESVQTRRNSR